MTANSRRCIAGMCAVTMMGLWLLAANAARASIESRIETWQTEQGASVLFYRAPAVPMLDIRVSFRAGAVYDGERHGLARLTNAMLAEKTGDMDAVQIANAFAATGARFHQGSTRESAWVSLRTLSDASSLEQSLETFVQVLRDPEFDETDLERIRRQMLVATEAAEKSPYDLASAAIHNMLYGQHPYANPPGGSQSTLAKLDVAQAIDFYHRFYVSRNAVIAMIGDVTPQRAHTIAARISGALPVGKRAPAPPPVMASAHRGKDVHIAFGSQQSQLLLATIGIKRTAPDYFDFLVANRIFGHGSGSRLNETVRETHGLAYSIGSSFRAMTEAGPFTISVRTRQHSVPETLALVRAELRRFVKQGISEQELSAAKRSITGGFALRLDGNRKLLGFLATIAHHGLPLNFLDRFNDRINAVTAESAMRAFVTRIDPERLLTVVVGEKGA